MTNFIMALGFATSYFFYSAVFQRAQTTIRPVQHTVVVVTTESQYIGY